MDAVRSVSTEDAPASPAPEPASKRATIAWEAATGIATIGINASPATPVAEAKSPARPVTVTDTHTAQAATASAIAGNALEPGRRVVLGVVTELKPAGGALEPDS